MNRVRNWASTVPVLAMLAATVAVANPAGADPAQTLSCGAVVTQSTRLANDVGPCPGNGLTVKGNGITLDLNGHSVIGTFTPEAPLPPTNTTDAVGISLDHTTGSTVRNGTVYHFAAGVALHGGSQNHLTTLDVHDNIGVLPTDTADNGDGIDLFGSNHNLIDHNQVVHNGVWSGISLLSHDASTGTDGASYNTITDNRIMDNNVAMLNSSGGPDWKRDIGVAIEGPGSTHNLVSHNVISGSGRDGVTVFPDCINGYNISAGCAGTVPNDYNVITHNIVDHNAFGLPVDSPMGDGILVLSMGPKVVVKPGHTTIVDNVVTNNYRNGIGLGGGNGEDLPGGTAGGNYGCSNISGGGSNTGVPTAALCGVSYNTVVGNTSSGNGEDGIWIGPKSNFNSINHNDVTANHRDGVAIGLAVQYDANNQAMFDANGNPITIPGTAGTDNTLMFNHGADNGRWDGRDDNPNCDNNDWDHNRFQTVNQACVLGSDPQPGARVSTGADANPGGSQANRGEDMYLGRRGSQ